MNLITSKDNEIIKNIRKLKEKKYREEQKLYVVEGIKLVKEAIQENADIDTIIISVGADAYTRHIDAVKGRALTASKSVHLDIENINNYNCIYVTENVFKYVSNVENPQGLMALIKISEEDTIDYNEDLILVLDGIQDPGNLGTIIRTADSVGLKQIIVSRDTVDSFNPKVVRSTMGAVYRVKIIRSDNLLVTLKMIKENGFKVYATDLKTDNNIYNIELNKTAIIIGNEANGVSKEIIETVENKVKIPMLGKTESLNASVATGVILYEYLRKKLNS